jgi:signal transduction histidine kinase
MIVKNLAHELKNPLQVINGYNDINLIQKDSKYSEKIKNEIKYMNEMITNMLSEEQFLRLSEINVNDLVTTLVDRYLESKVEYEFLKQLKINSDLNRLEQVLIVILTNIDKHSDKKVMISIIEDKLRFFNLKKKGAPGNKIGVKILDLQLKLLKINYEIIDNEEDYCTILYFGEDNEKK